MNWNDRISAAEKRGSFLKRDRTASEDWKTCAVGEWSGYFKANDDGSPNGDVLTTLGRDFCDYVLDDKILEARQTHNKILSYFRRNLSRRKTVEKPTALSA